MATISSEGLAQEHRVLAELGTTYASRMEKRGLTAAKFTSYAGMIDDMEEKRTDALGTNSQKKGLTGKEANMRQDVLTLIRPLQEAAKKSFPKGSPELKEFHVGDIISDSTPLLLAWAKDTAAASVKYLSTLAPRGVLQADIDALNAAAGELKQTDTKQETAKLKVRPEATAAFAASVRAVIECADSIHTAAGLEFAKEPAVLAQFEAAKKLRYEMTVRQNRFRLRHLHLQHLRLQLHNSP
jgi:hypothetical protein